MILLRINRIALVLIASTLLCLASCKTTQTDSTESQTPATVNANIARTDSVHETADEESRNSNHDAASPLPAYQYTGDDPLHQAIADYLVQEIGKFFSPSDVCIPSMTIVGTDTENPEDIRVWGDFWIFNYKQDGDTLLTESGGSHPGLIHLKKSDNGYTVTKMDTVADGEDNLKSAKEIFGDKYEAFHQINSNADEREKVRLRFISDYVKANKLQMKKVKDFGWDPVVLP